MNSIAAAIDPFRSNGHDLAQRPSGWSGAGGRGGCAALRGQREERHPFVPSLAPPDGCGSVPDACNRTRSGAYRGVNGANGR